MKPIPIAKRFWPKVDKRGPDECWPWIAAIAESGYGVISRSGVVYRNGRYSRMCLSHRISWELHFGPIPDGLCVLHRCDNRPCVNPKHLFLGTLTDNNDDMFAKGRGGYTGSPGESHPRAKLCDRDIRKIRALYSSGTSQAQIGRMFHLYQGSVSNIVLRKSWAHVQ